MEVLSKRQLNVELFQVEMPTNNNNNNNNDSCSACDTVHGKLVKAVDEVQNLFHRLNCEILVRQTTISTLEEAEKLGIIASPTIRVGNFDFYPQHLSDRSEAREWDWNGHTVSEPSIEVLIEVVMKGYFEKEKTANVRELSPYIVNYLKDIEPPQTSCGCSK
ncbi:hypothetical protein [Algoriphagus sp.]|uniref:hypothetical protein n=1 Tax=Algoriphagus sp. TaxID=1872435 RepID=UPI003F6E71E4